MHEPFADTVDHGHEAGWRTIRHFAYVDRPFRTVRRSLADDAAQILGLPDGRDGSEPTVELRVRRGGFDLGRDVKMTIGELEVGVHSARLPVRWEDATHPGLFPLLEATLEVAPVKAGSLALTQLGLFGRYRPPFGRLGAFGDNFAGHRIVIESVDRFLDGLVAHFHATIPDEAAGERNGDASGGQADPRALHRRRIILPVEAVDRRPGGAIGLVLQLQSTAGVIDASVNPRTGLAMVDYDSRVCNPERLLHLIEDTTPQ